MPETEDGEDRTAHCSRGRQAKAVPQEEIRPDPGEGCRCPAHDGEGGKWPDRERQRDVGGDRWKRELAEERVPCRQIRVP